MPPDRAPPTVTVLPRDPFPRGASRHRSQHLRLTGSSLCSSVEMMPEGTKKHLLHSCFSSVFWLPPKEDMQGLDTSLYYKVSVGALRSPGAPWSPCAKGQLDMYDRAGSQLCFSTLVLCPLPMDLATSSAASCAAHSSFAGLRPFLGTVRQSGFPPLTRGVQICLLGVRGTAEILPPPFVLLAGPARHGHHVQMLVFSSPASSLSKELQNILQVWHGQRVGWAGAVFHLGGQSVRS